MRTLKGTEFSDRSKNSTEAKKALLERFKARPAADDPTVLARQEERRQIIEAREVREAERRRLKEEEKARQEAAKHEETVNYLFKRTKQLSSLVSEFHHRVVIEQPGSLPPEQNINYENTLSKLEAIFRDFEKFKFAATGKRFEFFGEGERKRVESERRDTNGLNFLTPPASSKLRAFSPLQERFASSGREPAEDKERPADSNKDLQRYFLKTDVRR